MIDLMDGKLKSRAKSRILRWFDSTSPSPADRAKMSKSIDCVFDELPKRAGRWFEVMTVVLADTADISFVVRSRAWRTIPCSKGLAVSTVVPGWAFGWAQVLPDQFAYDALTWFSPLRSPVHSPVAGGQGIDACVATV
jgi:hypothetical protein